MRSRVGNAIAPVFFQQKQSRVGMRSLYLAKSWRSRVRNAIASEIH
ncbi:hypothetical protein AB3R30_22940 [Leptolyngbyaceae cyanobacterium UHCC 1019]